MRIHIENNRLYYCELERAERDDNAHIELIEYIIPDGVEIIKEIAFRNCSKISSVVIPSSVRKIGINAFENCENLVSVTIQEGLEVIRDSAFCGCENLRTINIPDSVQEIGHGAFDGCDSLETFKIGKRRKLLGRDVFGRCFPERLKSSLIDLLPYVHDSDKFEYFRIIAGESLQNYGADRVASIVLSMPDVSYFYRFICADDGDKRDLVKAMAKKISQNKNDRTCLLVAHYIAMHYKWIDADSLRATYAAIKKVSHSDAAARIIESDKILMAKMGHEVTGKPDNPLEHLVLEETADRLRGIQLPNGYQPPFEILQNAISWIVSYRYQIPLDKMHFPRLKDIHGNVVSEFVVEWLMVENEDFCEYYVAGLSNGVRSLEFGSYEELSTPKGYLEFTRWGNRRVGFRIQSGYNKRTEKILQLIDGDSLQEALLQIAEEYIKGKKSAKHNRLAIPILRFANEKTFMEVSKKLRGKLTSACVVNRTRAGMDFAYHHGYIEEYAEAMGLGEGTVRSMVYFDIDLDANGCKTYGLGGQSAKAVFQPADGLMIEMPNGETLESFPIANSDDGRYQCAQKDFEKLKKTCHSAYANYEHCICKSFLSGCEWRVEWWEEAFHSNYMSNYFARRVVWEQGGKTFMMKENGFVDSSLLPYSLSKEPIKVAHPMEMGGNDIRFWRKYLANNGMDAWQMSEPIVNMDDVKEDRYAGIHLELSNYFGLKKDGIYVAYPLQSGGDGGVYYQLALEDVHVRDVAVTYTESDIFYLDDDDEPTENYAWVYNVTSDDRIELSNIEIEKPSRYANHVIATLDKIVVDEWIMEDNVSISDFLPEFTYPQIMEFVELAQDANSTNVLAILLDYLDKAKDDYGLMDESEPS